MKIDNLLHSVKDYGTYVRISNSLHEYGIKNTAQLKRKTARDLLLIRNFGKKSLMVVERELKKRNMSLKRMEAK